MIEVWQLLPGIEAFRDFVNDAAANEFARTSLIFVAAAWVHSRQVSKEIRKQVGTLVEVLEKDLRVQQTVLRHLTARVSRIESKLNLP
jgi:hypothetical protein